jgi:hypothetical protein
MSWERMWNDNWQRDTKEPAPVPPCPPQWLPVPHWEPGAIAYPFSIQYQTACCNMNRNEDRFTNTLNVMPNSRVKTWLLHFIKHNTVLQYTLNYHIRYLMNTKSFFILLQTRMWNIVLVPQCLKLSLGWNTVCVFKSHWYSFCHYEVCPHGCAAVEYLHLAEGQHDSESGAVSIQTVDWSLHKVNTANGYALHHMTSAGIPWHSTVPAEGSSLPESYTFVLC